MRIPSSQPRDPQQWPPQEVRDSWAKDWYQCQGRGSLECFVILNLKYHENLAEASLQRYSPWQHLEQSEHQKNDINKIFAG